MLQQIKLFFDFIIKSKNNLICCTWTCMASLPESFKLELYIFNFFNLIIKTMKTTSNIVYQDKNIEKLTKNTIKVTGIIENLITTPK
jgi:hypothetical protein